MQEHSVSVKMYMPLTLLSSIDERCKSLNITRSEYLRLITMLDISYLKKIKYEQNLNTLTDIINDIDSKLYREV